MKKFFRCLLIYPLSLFKLRVPFYSANVLKTGIIFISIITIGAFFKTFIYKKLNIFNNFY